MKENWYNSFVTHVRLLKTKELCGYGHTSKLTNNTVHLSYSCQEICGELWCKLW